VTHLDVDDAAIEQALQAAAGAIRGMTGAAAS
jgi:hypothetical protein